MPTKKPETTFNRFSSLDSYLAGFLLLKGHRPSLENQGGKIVFVYVSGPELEEAISEFYSGAQVGAAAFAASVKSLRGLIHEMRTEKGETCAPAGIPTR